MSRPTIDPALLAALTEAAPGRLVRKLDKEPGLAEAWSWAAEGEGWRITTDGETVTLRGARLAEADAVGCTCLLAPKCLHILAVVSVLPLDEAGGAATDADPEPEGPADEADDPPTRPIEPAQREAAARARAVAASTLEVGAHAVGAVRQAELLRCVHACRAVGLHRAAAAGVRVVQGIRGLRAESVTFRTGALVEAFHELLATTAVIRAAEDAPAAALGTARRAYAPLSGRRLHGLFCEPVISATGYAGVVVWLCDDEGRPFQLGDVQPGGPDRAGGAYRGEITIGEVAMAPRALCRAGLLLQRGTASEDGRLGRGQDVAAVRGRATHWADEGPARMWATPLAEQIAAAWDPAGPGLVFVDGVIRGPVSGGGLALQVVGPEGVGGPTIRCTAPLDHPALPASDNVARLAGAAGLPVRAILRVERSRAGTAALMALSEHVSEDEPSALRLPEAWGGRINVGLDRLQGAHLPPNPAAQPLEAPEAPDPTAALRRRLSRAVLGGRGTLPPEAAGELAREAAALQRDLMPTGATLLRALAAAATESDRNLWGARVGGDPERFAAAWTVAASWEQAARGHLLRAGWGA